MSGSITVNGILGLSPCRPYKDNSVYLSQLFKGSTTVTTQDVLKFDIPDKDKLWLIVNGNLLSEDQCTKLSQVYLSKIPQDSVYYKNAEGRNFRRILYCLSVYKIKIDEEESKVAVEMLDQIRLVL